jgi:RHH-type proline utilization regulon transcriptional repressor/proline dehydrogenase/delta 1-pyrroline-5-carboxylate dehydrogenase
VNFDMEQSALKISLRLFQTLLAEPEFAAGPDSGHRSARSRPTWGHRLGATTIAATVRLVKGAYWDYETITARQRGWPVPVF